MSELTKVRRRNFVDYHIETDTYRVTETVHCKFVPADACSVTLWFCVCIRAYMFQFLAFCK